MPQRATPALFILVLSLTSLRPALHSPHLQSILLSQVYTINMMAGIMSYFGGRRDPKASSRDAIVRLRQQLQMIEKKGEYLQKKIEEETKTARANAVANKQGVFCTLRELYPEAI